MNRPKDIDPREMFPIPKLPLLKLRPNETHKLLQDGIFLGGHTMPWGSNYTFMLWLSEWEEKGNCIRVIYKPRDGERPLSDFRQGTLYQREYAAYLLSQELGWPNVPTTLIRNGPYGIGSMQLYVDCDPRITYFDMRDDMGSELVRLATFDLLVNNGDRKASHCLLDNNSNIWSIDHGLTFHTDFKLRTVMLEFCGKSIPLSLLSDLKSLLGRLTEDTPLRQELSGLISDKEILALIHRLQYILKIPIFPILAPNRNIPWPLV